MDQLPERALYASKPYEELSHAWLQSTMGAVFATEHNHPGGALPGTASPPDPRARPLCLCGEPTATVEIYDRVMNAWRPGRPMPFELLGARAVWCPSGAGVAPSSDLRRPLGGGVALIIGGVGRAAGGASRPPTSPYGCVSR